MQENKIVVFADGICPQCGKLCGNGGSGPLHCECGWEGTDEEIRARPIKAPQDKTMQIYNAGANLAIYYIARAFCVGSADIRAANMPIREKAKLLAERVQTALDNMRNLGGINV